MAMYEFRCIQCGEKLERYVQGFIRKSTPVCPKCRITMEEVEFSLPAKRNPEHGIQK